MKKLLSLLVMLAITLTPLCAFAAPGDAFLLRQGENGYDGGLIGLAEMDGTIYMLTYNALYTLGKDDAEPARHPWKQAEDEESKGGEDGDPSAGGTTNYDFKTLLPYEGRICVLAVRSLYERVVEDDGEDETNVEVNNTIEGAWLYEVTFDGEGNAALGEELLELDWDDMIQDEEDYQWSGECRMPFACDGILYFHTYDYNGNQSVMAYDLEDGSGWQVELDGLASDDSLNGMCAYTDGRFLCAATTWTQDGNISKLYSCDPDAEEWTQMLEFPSTAYAIPSGLAYVADKDALYYIMNGELHVIFGMDVSTHQTVAEVPLTYSADCAPIITADGLYVIGDYENVVRRNTDPSLRAGKRLTVQNQYNDSIQNAYYAFANQRGDVEVIMVQQVEDVVQAMMNRSTAVDIYCLSASSAGYDAVYSRGYMAELSESGQLSALMDEVYPFVRGVCTKDGEIVAVPMDISMNGRGYNPKAFERLGLSEADVPANWVEFFESLEPLAEKLAEIPGMSLFEPYYTRDQVRDQLFNSLFNDYMTHISQPENEFSFDTPVLREILAAYESVNWDALGLPEDDEEDDGGVYEVVVSSERNDSVLFATYTNVGPQTYSMESGMQALRLALAEGMNPMLAGELSVAFVNPFSENLEEAIAFLETAAREMEDMLKIQISPEQNEPIRDPYYESSLEQYDQRIEAARRELEKADEADKQTYEELLAEQESYRQDYLDNYSWQASAQSIARYRQVAGDIVVMRYFGLGSDNSEEFYTLTSQYTDGLIDAGEFVTAIDRKLQMMMKEGR